MLIGQQGDLWLWEAIDANGKRQKYQTHGPNVTQAEMLAHLRKHYRGLNIVSLERSQNPTRDYIPPQPDQLGNVKAHAFDHGIRRGLASAINRMGGDDLADMIRTAKHAPGNDPVRVVVAQALIDAQHEAANEIEVPTLKSVLGKPRPKITSILDRTSPRRNNVTPPRRPIMIRR